MESDGVDSIHYGIVMFCNAFYLYSGALADTEQRKGAYVMVSNEVPCYRLVVPAILWAWLVGLILFVPVTAQAQAESEAIPVPPAAALLPSATAPVAPEIAPTRNLPPHLEPAPAELPRDLTPFGMFMAADNIVKGVMLGLLSASVLTWAIALAKALELAVARRRLTRAQRILVAAESLADARPASAASPQVGRLMQAAADELQRSPDTHDSDGIKERITARFARIGAGVGRRMLRGTAIIATIGAIAPFVGLFGTVWGIMNSFIGISKLHTTNLAVVAPGIAEALLATAFGLAAAIPAVVIYNAFARSIADYRALYSDSSVEILTLVSRELSQCAEVRGGDVDPEHMQLERPAAE